MIVTPASTCCASITTMSTAKAHPAADDDVEDLMVLALLLHW